MGGHVNEQGRQRHHGPLPAIKHLALAVGHRGESHNVFFAAHERNNQRVNAGKKYGGADFVRGNERRYFARGFFRKHIFLVAAFAQHIWAARQGTQQPFFWQAGKVFLPKGHVFLKTRRGAVRLIFKESFVAGAGLAQIGRFAACKGRVHIGNYSNMKKEGQPVEHHM